MGRPRNRNEYNDHYYNINYINHNNYNNINYDYYNNYNNNNHNDSSPNNNNSSNNGSAGSAQRSQHPLRLPQPINWSRCPAAGGSRPHLDCSQRTCHLPKTRPAPCLTSGLP